MQHLKLDDFKNYRYIDNLKLSPDGKNAALLGRKVGKFNDYDTAIFVDMGHGFCPLTDLHGDISHFLWLDDENILFAEIRDKEDREKLSKGHELTCFYKININDGKAKLDFKAAVSLSRVELLSPGRYLAVNSYDNARPSLEGKTEEEQDALLKEYKTQERFQVIDELPFSADGRGITNKKRTLLSILTKDSLVSVTDKLANILDYVLSPCKKYLAYICDPAPAEIHNSYCNIHILNLETLEEKEALKEPKRIRAFDFWKDKLVVSFSEPHERRYEHGPFYIVDPDTKETTLLATFDLSIGEPGFSDSKFGCGLLRMVRGDSYYFTALKGFHSDIFELNLNSGKISNLTNSNGDIEYFDMENGRIVMGMMEPGRLMEVYELKNSKLERISNFNDDFHNSHVYSSPEHFSFKDSDGFEIDGWVIKPACYEADKKYPAILNIHGGPKLAYNDGYFHEMQYWAAQGYFVIYSNPRGSDGKGNEFADIRGRYGTVDYENLMLFVDECLESYPGIDKERLGVTGGSYGGFMTSWIVGHTERFRAAVSQCSISNWISFYLTSDIGYFYGKDQMDGDPWNGHEKLWHHSPLKYAPNVKTPTLVLHSCEDYRCCIPEAQQWYAALKLHGVNTKLVIFHGDNHEMPRTGNPESRIRRLKEITEWMDKYLK